MKTTRTLTILVLRSEALLRAVVLVLALGLSAEVANADFTFGDPTNLGPTVNSSAHDSSPSITADGLSLYFGSKRPGGLGDEDIWFTTRTTTSEPWGEPVNLGTTVNTTYWEWAPSISYDGLELYFNSNRPGPSWSDNDDLWVTSRATLDDDWSAPVNLGPTVNSSSIDWSQSISADGLELFFMSNRPGGSGSEDIWVTTRATTSDPWSTPVNLGPTVNSPSREAMPNISADGRMLFFHVNRPGGLGRLDIWVTTRETTNSEWSAPVNLGPPINSSYIDGNPCISADGSILFFLSTRLGGIGGQDLWQAPIEPVVDLNGDGIVDAADMCIVVDHWGTDNQLCDIGPMPWGDGIVNVQDLAVLAEHLFTCPGTVAHWPLDETEGDIAYDSVAANDAVVTGGAVWQPDGGQVRGALAFDGIDDYVSAPLMLDRAKAVFSVFAWIKGGMPGQVVFSQAGASDWLSADTTNGSLMTELRFLGKSSLPLLSQTVITDGNWHCIGLVWDGSNRILYVDDVEVASDTYDQGYLVGDLQIGTGKDLESGSFFSGLIDDVRIYNRAIIP